MKYDTGLHARRRWSKTPFCSHMYTYYLIYAESGHVIFFNNVPGLA
jgi:hypothetical protein